MPALLFFSFFIFNHSPLHDFLFTAYWLEHQGTVKPIFATVFVSKSKQKTNKKQTKNPNLSIFVITAQALIRTDTKWNFRKDCRKGKKSEPKVLRWFTHCGYRFRPLCFPHRASYQNKTSLYPCIEKWHVREMIRQNILCWYASSFYAGRSSHGQHTEV